MPSVTNHSTFIGSDRGSVADGARLLGIAGNISKSASGGGRCRAMSHSNDREASERQLDLAVILLRHMKDAADADWVMALAALMLWEIEDYEQTAA